VGAVLDNESIYVSSRDQHLYALEKHNGSLRWKYQFAYPTHTATIVGNVVYINIHGAYALSSVDGTLLWHKHYPSSIAPLAVVTSAFSSFAIGQSNGEGAS